MTEKKRSLFHLSMTCDVETGAYSLNVIFEPELGLTISEVAPIAISALQDAWGKETEASDTIH